MNKSELVLGYVCIYHIIELFENEKTYKGSQRSLSSYDISCVKTAAKQIKSTKMDEKVSFRFFSLN